MANLVDSFLGGFQRAAGYADRNRQVQSQMQMQDMAAAEFNNQQYDRAMGKFARNANTAVLDVKDKLMQQGINKNSVDLGIEDFVTAYGKEEAINVLNHIGFGAGTLGKNKFIADLTFNQDGTVTPTVGVYDKDEEGKNYVYSERFTKDGKKVAEGGEYKDLDIKGVDATLQRYLQGVRGDGGMTPQVEYMERTQKGAFNFGDRTGAEQYGEEAVTQADNPPPVISDSLAGDNQGFGITTTPQEWNTSMGGDPHAIIPDKVTIPMQGDLLELLPGIKKITMHGEEKYILDPVTLNLIKGGALEGVANNEGKPFPEELKNYIETNKDVPLNMTQEQFNSLTDAEQAMVRQYSRALSDRTISERAKKILMPKGSSVSDGGGLIPRWGEAGGVRSNIFDYKDGEKISGRGESNSQRKARKDDNKVIHDTEGEIYSWLQNNPEAFLEFEKDPRAFVNNPKYFKDGKLITPAPAKVVTENKVKLKKVAKNITRNKDGGVTGTPTDQDAQTVAGIISQNTNTSNQAVNMRQYGRNDRISIAKTILASIPPQQQGLYISMLGTFEETGMMTLDPAKLQIAQLNAQTQAQYGKDQTPSVRKYIEDQGMILAGYNPKDGVSTDFDRNDLPEFVNGLSVMIGNARNKADLDGLALIAGQALNLYIEDEATDGILGTIKTWLYGGPNTGGFSISPNVRGYNAQGKIVTDFSQRNTIIKIGIEGEDGTRDGDFVSVGEIRGSLDQGGLDMLLGYATKAGSI